jgi:predicted nucleotidyltransferase
MTVAETLRSVLDQMPAVRLAVLFGSAAEGTARPVSDLDVGVSLQPGAERSPSVGVPSSGPRWCSP